MRQKRFIPFHISGIDSLGQGVSKLTDKVTFIPKTAIGDKGEALVMSEKKGVAFARASSFSERASTRINPACVHFDECPSCHYQHVPYEQELTFKMESFERLFRKMPLPNIEVIGAPERYYYRNRIQLHYSTKAKLIGMRNPATFEITPIPDCLIAVPEILKELKLIYENDNWLKLVPASQPEGHVELYWINQSVKISWNRPYADGGFTQVYALMNEKLKDVLSKRLRTEPIKDLLDLFGGNGNLSLGNPYSKRLCVDIYSEKKSSEFMNQDLYHSSALKNVVKERDVRGLNISHMIIDPPRSGFREFSLWLDTFRPSFAAYVSCDPHTLARDLSSVSDYSITAAFLIDFFPSTFHFESMIFLERKS